jgi:PadR family transcriptional regulator, regulatory protein PadR
MNSESVLLLSQWKYAMLPVGNPITPMKEKTDVLQGSLALMALKTLDVLGPLHGYGIARRIEQISGDLLTVNQGTLYPVLLKLEQEGSIASEWGASENNRKARFYRLTRGGRKQLRAETRGWEQTAAIMGRFFVVKSGRSEMRRP